MDISVVRFGLGIAACILGTLVVVFSIYLKIGTAAARKEGHEGTSLFKEGPQSPSEREAA